ncbi:Protein of unknown function [Actinacidiphila alni]|uniref:DUF2993 domain-containing protein n=1 Tax=Actinacidiphila alni TaxID=380248 RepID=A0A1I2KGK6_9ACTN|nr:LmeA family phospholipid-binding protein [Actinacidiphila alni]SFF66084.1 Protein of unknown function [Actinacidiphila alni]
MKLRRKRYVLIAAAALLAGAATTVDLVVEHAARSRIAAAVACRLQPSGRVSADLTSAFAGLRAVTGNLGGAHISAAGVRRDGTVVEVAADLRDVSTDGTTGGGTATATITFAELRKRIAARDDGAAGGPTAGLPDGLTLGADHGALVLTGTAGPLRLPVTVHTRVTTAQDSVTVTPTTVSVLGQEIAVDRLAAVPGGGDLAGRLGPRTVPLPELPGGVRLSGARADDRGLVLALDIARGAAGADRTAACT